MVDRSVTPLDVLRVSRTIFHDGNNKMTILCTLQSDPIKKNAYYNAYYIVARKARGYY